MSIGNRHRPVALSGVKHLQIKAALALLALVVLSGFSCGKRKPPLPPVPKVVQRAEISGFQRGSRVILSWKMPDKNAPANDVTNIKRVDIYRLADKISSPDSISEQQFSSRSVLIASIPVRDDDFGSKPMTYTDTLQFAGQPSRLRYAVRFVNSSGQKAAFSNLIVIEPEAKVAAGPTSLSAQVTQNGVKLEWTAPVENADGTRPVNLVGYNVYRSASKTQAAALLNKTPITASQFDDVAFEFGKEYYYFVRAVSSGAGASRTESTESNIVEVKPEDTFRPSAPASITIAAAPDTISLFFPPNPESDVVGYKIYRSTDDKLPKTEWQLVTPKPIDTNTFQDKDVKAATQYFYYVIAVDKFGNESPPSEPVSETVPQT